LTDPVEGRLEAARRRRLYELGEDDDGPVFLPCVVGMRTHRELPYYDATLLVPPGMARGSELLSPGMAVLRLRVLRRLGGRGDQKGFILESEYTGDQQFYAGLHSSLVDLGQKDDVEFQGAVWDVPGGGRRPVVRILNDSVRSPVVFEKNRETLKSLKELQRLGDDVRMQQQHRDFSGVKFWWDMELPPETNLVRPDSPRFY
jgi:hypothetical protein